REPPRIARAQRRLELSRHCARSRAHVPPFTLSVGGYGEHRLKEERVEAVRLRLGVVSRRRILPEAVQPQLDRGTGMAPGAAERRAARRSFLAVRGCRHAIEPAHDVAGEDAHERAAALSGVEGPGYPALVARSVS